MIMVGRVIDQTDESRQRSSTIWRGEKMKRSTLMHNFFVKNILKGPQIINFGTTKLGTE